MSVEARIYNPSLELEGIIDEFSTLVWLRRYQSPGEFEIHTPYSEESRRLLIPENIIQRYDGLLTMEAGVIESLSMTEDEITAKGRFLESYLDRRLIKETAYYTGRVETSFRRIINEMVPIPLLELGELQGLTETLRFQATYKSVLYIIQKACKATAVGFRIRPDFSARKMYFEVYKGAETNVVFSDKYDNMTNERYEYDGTQYSSKVFATQTIDDVRRVYSVGGGSGLSLREYHTQTQADTNGRTETEIRESMETLAQRVLDSRVVRESFNFSANADAPFAYRTDWDVGDLVHVKHAVWGIDLQLRMTEIEEDYEGGGREVIPTCGDPLPEIMDFEEG